MTTTTLEIEHSSRWKMSDSVLMYIAPSYQFHNKVVIMEFENCLIKKIPPGTFYHAIDQKSIEPYNEEFIKTIKQESTDYGMVIISHAFGNGKLTIDSLKTKFENLVERYNFPLIALFALKPNKFSKPHTGMWKFLKVIYKQHDAVISKKCVISEYGGRIISQEKKNGTFKYRVDNTDMDRAFAANIGAPYYTVKEYLSDDLKEKFQWNRTCLPPEDRATILQKIEQYKNPGIFETLFSKGQYDTYIILIYGAPRAGKTTLANEIHKKWSESKFGETNVIKVLSDGEFTRKRRISEARKTLLKRISVIVDGTLHMREQRKPFFDLAEETKSRILCIEVNPSIGIANVLNHVAVELANDETTLLKDLKEYYLYKTKLERDDNAIVYCPAIKKIKEVMYFRY